MKRFLLSFLKFILPFLLMLVAIELYVLYFPSTFNKKATYLKNNITEITTIILGSSHNQNSLNPEYLHFNTANLANSGQDIQLDSALFFSYAKKLTALKQVILELDYFSLEEKIDSPYFRIPWYHRFYGIDLYPISFLNKISVYSSSPAFFNKVIQDEINPFKIKYRYNKYGFILNDFPGVMEDYNYDSLKLAETAAERLKDKHTKVSYENFLFNRSKLDAIIHYCLFNNIKVILLSNPMYTTYIQNEVAEKINRKNEYVDSLLSLHDNITYFNFEKSKLFKVHDFKNDDHLNSNGAKKFTIIIDSLLNHNP